ncbi:zinc finger BED domain-containing protein RICESLEEPER 1-like protein [Tanacetum coccineum]
MCIKDNQPFSIVDDEGFMELVWYLNSEFEMPYRWTVARGCLSLFQEEKTKLKHLLKNQTECLTTDTWTFIQNYNYMCLTTHWIDEKWNLKKNILNFCQISNHKGVTIGKYYAHTINLIVRDGVEEHITSVDKVFEIITWLQVINPNNRSYFRNEVEDDSEDSIRSRKRRKMIEF